MDPVGAHHRAEQLLLDRPRGDGTAVGQNGGPGCRAIVVARGCRGRLELPDVDRLVVRAEEHRPELAVSGRDGGARCCGRRWLRRCRRGGADRRTGARGSGRRSGRLRVRSATTENDGQQRRHEQGSGCHVLEHCLSIVSSIARRHDLCDRTAVRASPLQVVRRSCRRGSPCRSCRPRRCSARPRPRRRTTPTRCCPPLRRRRSSSPRGSPAHPGWPGPPSPQPSPRGGRLRRQLLEGRLGRRHHLRGFRGTRRHGRHDRRADGVLRGVDRGVLTAGRPRGDAVHGRPEQRDHAGHGAGGDLHPVDDHDRARRRTRGPARRSRCRMRPASHS